MESKTIMKELQNICDFLSKQQELSTKPLTKEYGNDTPIYLYEYDEFVEKEMDTKEESKWDERVNIHYSQSVGIIHGYGVSLMMLHNLLKKYDEELIETLSQKKMFDNVPDAYDYYWDDSRNPNGNWETENALEEGELKFCESFGFFWDEWIKCRNRKNK